MPASWCTPTPCAFSLSHRRLSSVVLVGSSPEVLTTTLGKAVDDYDTVVRFNCAPTRGFEKHVGSRTSFRLINKHAEPDSSKQPDVGRAPQPLPGIHEANVAFIIALAVHGSSSSLHRGESYNSYFSKQVETNARCHPGSPLTGYRSAFVDFATLMRIREAYGIDQPTTGFTAVALFSRFFTRPVTLHGFGGFGNRGGGLSKLEKPSSLVDVGYASSAPQHYWVNGSLPDACGKRLDSGEEQQRIHWVAHNFHNATREQEVLRQMARAGVVQFLSDAAAEASLGPGGAVAAAAARRGMRLGGAALAAADTSGAPSGGPGGGGSDGNSGGGGGSGRRRRKDSTCLTGCVPHALPMASPHAHSSCRWRAAPAPASSGSSGSSGHADALRMAYPETFGAANEGCLPPPECCLHYHRDSFHHLYRKRLNDGGIVRVGAGFCLEGFYRGWADDPPAVRTSLTNCLAVCKADARCAYVAYLPGKSCSRYDERAGVECCGAADGAAQTHDGSWLLSAGICIGVALVFAALTAGWIVLVDVRRTNRRRRTAASSSSPSDKGGGGGVSIGAMAVISCACTLWLLVVVLAVPSADPGVDVLTLMQQAMDSFVADPMPAAADENEPMPIVSAVTGSGVIRGGRVDEKKAGRAATTTLPVDVPPSTAGVRWPTARPRAAYVFGLVGSCNDRHKLSLLAGVTLLLETRPRFPIVIMLTTGYQRDVWLHSQLGKLGVLVAHVGELPGGKCTNPSKRTAYFVPTYAFARVWSLTQFEALLYLDSDLAVAQRLDHLLRHMLHQPTLRELRTPTGCAAPADPHTMGMNVGVWGVRPNATTFRHLRRFVRSGYYDCGIGFQDAAISFFSAARWSAAYWPHATPNGSAQALHVGYNLKADVGATGCLRKQGLRDPRDVYVVHWSGTRKPENLTTDDPVEQPHLHRWQRAHRSWAAALARERGGCGKFEGKNS